MSKTGADCKWVCQLDYGFLWGQSGTFAFSLYLFGLMKPYVQLFDHITMLVKFMYKWFAVGLMLQCI